MPSSTAAMTAALVPTAPTAPALIATLLATALVACSSPQPAPTPASPPAPTAPAPAAASAPVPRASLSAEQSRLAALFRGTPVVFVLQRDGSLRATVPRRFSFDTGTAKVKAPLAAVLDRLAKSQAPANTRLRVSAPADADARAPALANQRAASVREHLIAQGIGAARVQIGTLAPADQVEIVVSEGR